jgi:hypothetical protein
MESFEALFKGKKAWVAKTMEVPDHFLKLLEDKNIIENAHARKIKEKQQHDERADQLMEILERRPDEEVEVFKKILRSTNQPKVMKLLWPDPYSATQQQSVATNQSGSAQTTVIRASGSQPRDKERLIDDNNELQVNLL